MEGLIRASMCPGISDYFSVAWWLLLDSIISRQVQAGKKKPRVGAEVTVLFLGACNTFPKRMSENHI